MKFGVLLQALELLRALWAYTWFKVGLLVVLVGAALGGLYYRYQDEVQRRIIAELALAGQQQVTAATVARLAADGKVRDSLQATLAAERALHGRTIAALRLRLRARDTVVVHDTLPTLVFADGRREAHFRDSTFAGTIDGTLVAPPYPAPLGIHYTFHRPVFTPEVAFIQVGSGARRRVVATVSWQGEQVDIETPYAHLPEPPLPFLGYFGEASWTLVGELKTRGGLLLRFDQHWHATSAVEWTLVDGVSLNFGLRYER